MAIRGLLGVVDMAEVAPKPVVVVEPKEKGAFLRSGFSRVRFLILEDLGDLVFVLLDGIIVDDDEKLPNIGVPEEPNDEDMVFVLVVY